MPTRDNERHRVAVYCELIGRMEATLEGLDRVLARWKPKTDIDKHELKHAKEMIAKRLAEIAALFPKRTV